VAGRCRLRSGGRPSRRDHGRPKNLEYALGATRGIYRSRDIDTFKGETLFWSAILVSNTLGTSSGDFLSDSSGLGYLGANVVVTGILVVLVALRYVRQVPNVLLFWIAFVLTRPFGACSA
jgi:uncharacterized membrane-anchored protein